MRLLMLVERSNSISIWWPLEFINVPMTDSSTLTMCIKDCLVQFCLPINQHRGQAYDGAVNMLGHINGVAAQIQKEQQLAIHVHCLAHCTNLCLQSQLSCDTPCLKPLCLTRWAVRTSAIQTVITNYEFYCNIPCEINEGGRDEYAIKAGGILNLMKKMDWSSLIWFFLQQNNFPSVSKVKTPQFKKLCWLQS